MQTFKELMNITLTGKMAAVKKISDIIFAQWHIFIFLIFDHGPPTELYILLGKKS